MNKKLMLVVGVILLCALFVILLFVVNHRNSENQNQASGNENLNENEGNNDNDEIENRKILVVYFSAQGHTEEVAKKLADNLNADIFEIVPVDEYTSEDLDWTDDHSRVTLEHEGFDKCSKLRRL